MWNERRADIERLTKLLLRGTPPVDPPARSGPAPDAVRVASWNIQRGADLDRTLAFLGAHEQLRTADVLLLNEVDLGMARSGNRHVAREIAEAYGYHWVFGNSYLCLDFGDTRDGSYDVPNAVGLHGNAVLSRFPISSARNFSVAITKDKFHSSEKRLGHKKALWAVIEAPSGPLPVVSVHLDAFASSAQRGAQLEDTLQEVDRAGFRRVLVGGDFNTSTYDAKNAPRILLNVLKKGFRGGFPHAMHHYLYPDKLYERPVFEALERHGLTWEPFVEVGVATSWYEVGDWESESKVRDQLPGVFVTYLRYRLRPWNGVAGLRLDWFAGRGLEASAPATFAKPTWEGTLLSDHDPIMVEVRPAPGLGGESAGELTTEAVG